LLFTLNPTDKLGGSEGIHAGSMVRIASSDVDRPQLLRKLLKDKSSPS
jgi:hypothetical protein